MATVTLFVCDECGKRSEQEYPYSIVRCMPGTYFLTGLPVYAVFCSVGCGIAHTTKALMAQTPKPPEPGTP